LQCLQIVCNYKRVFGIFNKVVYDTTDFAPVIDVLRKVLLVSVAHVSVATVETLERSLKCDKFLNEREMP
jgi:hypothetical protein